MQDVHLICEDKRIFYGLGFPLNNKFKFFISEIVK